MHQLFYVSGTSESFRHEDINAILKKAHAYNSAHSISGVLLFHSGIFLQLLEGERSAVEELFQRKILKDPRHKNIMKIFAVDGNERIFPEWTMAFREVTDLDISMVNDILSWKRLISGAQNISNDLILRMLKSFQQHIDSAS